MVTITNEALAPSRTRNSARRVKNRISAILLVCVTVVIALPLVLIVVDSVRPEAEIASRPIGLPTTIAFENYVNVFSSMNYLRSLGNTLVIALLSVILVVVLAAPAAWVIGRRARWWSRAIYSAFIAGLTIPVFVVTTPLYLLMQQLGLLNTYAAAILIYTSFNLPFALFFYVSFLRAVPIELEDAAAIDGCSPLRTFVSIIFPLLRPATATISIFVVLNIWNDVIVPLLFLNTGDLGTVTLGVYSFIGTQGGESPSQLFPAVVLAAAPLVIIFLIIQRHIIAGITAGVGKS